MDPRRATAGVQLRYETGLTGEEYPRAEAWRDARLERCPNHPHGRCSAASHGTYARKTPPGARVPRWYCRESHTTISLLADCLAARLPGTLDDLEAGVVAAEGAQSLEAAANELRRPTDDDAVELPGATRSGGKPRVAHQGRDRGAIFRGPARLRSRSGAQTREGRQE